MRWTFHAENISCLKMQDARLAETRQSLRLIRPERQQRQRVFIFNFAVANFTMANELELMAAQII